MASGSARLASGRFLVLAVLVGAMMQGSQGSRHELFSKHFVARHDRAVVRPGADRGQRSHLATRRHGRAGGRRLESL